MSFLWNTVKKILGVHSPDSGVASPVVASSALSAVPVGEQLDSDDDIFEDAVRQLDFDTDSVLTTNQESVVSRSELPAEQCDTAAAGRVIQRRERDPSKFNGKSDWGDYRVHFEYVAQWNKWSHDEKGLQLAIALTDEAREVLTSLPFEVMHDYDALAAALEHRYSPVGREPQYLLELMSRECGPEEDVSTYGHTLRRLARKAYGNKKVDELILVNTFIKGLRNLDLKRHVYHAKPKSLTEAIQAAVEFEAFDRPFRECARKPRVTLAPVLGRDSVKQHTKSDDDRPHPGGGSGAVSMTAEMVSNIVKETLAGYTRQRRDKVECYNCHEKGHYSREYPQKSSAVANRLSN